MIKHKGWHCSSFLLQCSSAQHVRVDYSVNERCAVLCSFVAQISAAACDGDANTWTIQLRASVWFHTILWVEDGCEKHGKGQDGLSNNAFKLWLISPGGAFFFLITLVFDLLISSQHLLDPVRLMLAQTSVKLLQVFTGLEHRLTPPQLHVKAAPGKKRNEVQLCCTN